MTQLVGILNLTPDSFSDGGRAMAPDAALRAARAMLKQGAAVLDVGAESTRPDATPVAAAEEWARLADALPGLVAMAHQARAVLSLDTHHAATAQKALALGVDWINDVSGAEDPAMLPLLADARCRYVLTHALGVPPDAKRTLPDGCDPLVAVTAALREKIDMLETAGIARARLILDPGIGFGKTAAQSMELLRRAGELRGLGCPLLFGHSRKSFLAPLAPGAADGRDSATLAASIHLAGQGIDFLRVHAVAEHAQALACWHGLQTPSPQTSSLQTSPLRTSPADDA